MHDYVSYGMAWLSGGYYSNYRQNIGETSLTVGGLCLIDYI